MLRTRSPVVLACLVAPALLLGCDGEGASRPYQLQARAGVYDDGSGRDGLAVLATLRDAGGLGPSDAWAAELETPAGGAASATYAGTGAGSFAAWWWRDLAPTPGDYRLDLAGDGGAASAGFALGAARLALPQPEVSADGDVLAWAAIDGAGAYECRLDSAGAVVGATSIPSATPSCDLGALGPGAWAASVTAFGADLAALGADPSASPLLPDAFPVSEGRIGLARDDSGTVAVLRAAGGTLRYGGLDPGLAIWVSLTGPDGTPPASPWAISIAGPGIPSAAPISFTYPAGFDAQVRWSYDPPDTGLYTVTATSGALAARVRFAIGTPPELTLPAGVAATAGTQGAAQVEWSAVQGAAAYQVSVYTEPDGFAPGAFVAGLWTPAPSASFPAGTFTAGQGYEVYVTAVNVDVPNGGRTTQVAASENTFAPASFVGR